MPGRIAVTSWATPFVILIAMSAGLFASPAFADQSPISIANAYRDLSEFESATMSRLGRPASGGALAQNPGTGDAPAKPDSQRQPDKPPESVPRYKDGIYLINKDYWLNYPLNLWRFFSAPARFDETDWFIAAAVGTTAGVLVALDDEIREFWQDNITGGTSREVFDVFNFFGGAKFQVPTILGGYALAELTDQTGLMDTKRGKSAFILAAQSAILTQLLVGGIKYISGRDRPNENDDQNAFNGPASGTNKAFPSGHASAAFAFAGTISEVYQQEHPWVPWVLYPIATGTTLARVDRDKHWVSDVFVGGMIGYLMAATVVRYSPFLEENKMSFRPMGLEDGSGVRLIKRF
jgi:membrane-associated phospholipid phosphatase